MSPTLSDLKAAAQAVATWRALQLDGLRRVMDARRRRLDPWALEVVEACWEARDYDPDHPRAFKGDGREVDDGRADVRRPKRER